MAQHRYQPKTAAQIVQRLPLHRSLNDSQACLVALTPAWQHWWSQATQTGIFSAAPEACQLIAWQPLSEVPAPTKQVVGKLVIGCANTTLATCLKQRRVGIIEHLNQQLAIHKKTRHLIIDALVVRVQLGTEELPFTTQASKRHLSHHPILSDATFSEIDKAIGICQNQTTNEQLAQSLRNLANTLEQLKQQQ